MCRQLCMLTGQEEPLQLAKCSGEFEVGVSSFSNVIWVLTPST